MKASFKSLLSLILIFSISFPAFPAESLQAPAEKSESVPFKKRMIAKLKQGQKKLEKALRCITGKDSCSKQEWAEITIAAVALLFWLIPLFVSRCNQNQRSLSFAANKAALCRIGGNFYGDQYRINRLYVACNGAGSRSCRLFIRALSGNYI